MLPLTARFLSTSPPPRLRLLTGSSMIPDPRKRTTKHPQGEDAFFHSSERALGVADGVGSWALLNVDSGEFSRELMRMTKRFFETNPDKIDPVEAVIFAEKFAEAHIGSSTFCAVSLDGAELKGAVLGDSGFVVLRRGDGMAKNLLRCPPGECLTKRRIEPGPAGGWKVVFKSEEQQHAFNTPYQIGTKANGISAKNAVAVTIPVRLGDLIVVGTDGLFDNLFLNDVCQLVGKFFDSTGGLVHGCGDKGVDDAKHLAEYLTKAALAASMHPGRRSPFSSQCVKAGYDAHGGKGDDITTVVGIVVCGQSSST